MSGLSLQLLFWIFPTFICTFSPYLKHDLCHLHFSKYASDERVTKMSCDHEEVLMASNEGVFQIDTKT